MPVALLAVILAASGACGSGTETTGSAERTIRIAVIPKSLDIPVFQYAEIGAKRRAAELVLRAARTKANVRYVPRRWWCVGTVIRCIPSFLFKKMNV